MGAFSKSKFFHRNRRKEEIRNEGNRQKEEAEKRAAEAKAKALEQKQKSLQLIESDCKKSREEVDKWYKDSCDKAKSDYETTHKLYKDQKSKLNKEYQTFLDNLKSNFEKNKQQTLRNKAKDLKLISSCTGMVDQAIKGLDSNFFASKKTLDTLWDYAKTNLTIQNCLSYYESLKKPISGSDKTRNFSLVSGFFKHLSENSILEKHKSQQYINFCHSLYTDYSKKVKTKSYYKMDNEISSYLKSYYKSRNTEIFSSYKINYSSVYNNYNKKIKMQRKLFEKAKKSKKEVEKKYNDYIYKLEDKYYDQKYKMSNEYSNLSKKLHRTTNDLEYNYYFITEKIRMQKNEYLYEVDLHEAKEKSKLDKNYYQVVKTIDSQLKEVIKAIKKNVEDNIKQLKESIRSTITNAVLTVVSGAAAILSGGFLAGVSKEILEMVGGSLAATAGKSADRLFNGDNKVGVNVSGNVGLPGFSSSNFKTSSYNSNSLEAFKAKSLNFEHVINKFKKMDEEVNDLGTKIESNMFYSFTQNMPSNLSFSNALTNYVGNTPKENFLCKASFGVLQDNGLRHVKWDFKIDNKTRVFGNDYLRDKDIFNLVDKVSKTKRYTLYADWENNYNQNCKSDINLNGVKGNRFEFKFIPEENTYLPKSVNKNDSEIVFNKENTPFHIKVLNKFVPAANALTGNGVNSNNKSSKFSLSNIANNALGIATTSMFAVTGIKAISKAKNALSSLSNPVFLATSGYFLVFKGEKDFMETNFSLTEEYDNAVNSPLFKMLPKKRQEEIIMEISDTERKNSNKKLRKSNPQTYTVLDYIDSCNKGSSCSSIKDLSYSEIGTKNVLSGVKKSKSSGFEFSSNNSNKKQKNANLLNPEKEVLLDRHKHIKGFVELDKQLNNSKSEKPKDLMFLYKDTLKKNNKNLSNYKESLFDKNLPSITKHDNRDLLKGDIESNLIYDVKNSSLNDRVKLYQVNRQQNLYDLYRSDSSPYMNDAYTAFQIEYEMEQIEIEKDRQHNLALTRMETNRKIEAAEDAANKYKLREEDKWEPSRGIESYSKKIEHDGKRIKESNLKQHHSVKSFAKENFNKKKIYEKGKELLDTPIKIKEWEPLKSIFGDYDNSINSRICWFENPLTDSLNFNYGIKFYNKHDLKASILAHPKKLSFSAEGEGELLTGFHLMDANWKTSLGMFRMEANALTAEASFKCKTEINVNNSDISSEFEAKSYYNFINTSSSYESGKKCIEGVCVNSKARFGAGIGAGAKLSSKKSKETLSNNKKLIKSKVSIASSALYFPVTVHGELYIEAEYNPNDIDCSNIETKNMLFAFYDSNYLHNVMKKRICEHELSLNNNSKKISESVSSQQLFNIRNNL